MSSNWLVSSKWLSSNRISSSSPPLKNWHFIIRAKEIPIIKLTYKETKKHKNNFLHLDDFHPILYHRFWDEAIWKLSKIILEQRSRFVDGTLVVNVDDLPIKQSLFLCFCCFYIFYMQTTLNRRLNWNIFGSKMFIEIRLFLE